MDQDELGIDVSLLGRTGLRSLIRLTLPDIGSRRPQGLLRGWRLTDATRQTNIDPVLNLFLTATEWRGIDLSKWSAFGAY